MFDHATSPRDIACAAEAAIERRREMAEPCPDTPAEQSLHARGIKLTKRGPMVQMQRDGLPLAVVLEVRERHFLAIDIEDESAVGHIRYEDAFDQAAAIACRVHDAWVDDMKKEARRYGAR